MSVVNAASLKKFLKKYGPRDPSLACKPIDSYEELLEFLEDPPPWRTLCKELTPHSKMKVRNMDVNRKHPFSMEAPEQFCHYDPDEEEPVRCDEKDLPITLVCHDMANGYHDDSIIDGTTNYEAYTFYNWAGIDIFCYFSHHLITIPPVSWINVGHAHGVKVIGTVITEWAEGMAFWEQILESETKYRDFASALVAIAKTLKFDGWLLNIENKINNPEVLLQFVGYLHKLMHQELPHAVLVWYDSVTVQGHLNWQNSLNNKNKAFFDVSDYFFTNYSWTPEQVASSALVAGARLRDLCIGIDVWGRNFYGGGQFNIMEAVKVVYEAGCSIALFAPAWTHETMSSDVDDVNSVAMSKGLDNFERFLLRDRALWTTIWPFLHTHVPSQLPFQTSFCKGQGRKRWLYGEVICPGHWYNLRHQQYQAGAALGPHGYLLSSADNIRRVQRHQRTQDTGIIKLQSFLQMRHDLHPAQKRKSITFKALLEEFLEAVPHSDPEKIQTEKQMQRVEKNKPETYRDVEEALDDTGPNEEGPSAVHEEAEHPPKKRKRCSEAKKKIQTVFTSIMSKLKSPKREHEQEGKSDKNTPETEKSDLKASEFNKSDMKSIEHEITNKISPETETSDRKLPELEKPDIANPDVEIHYEDTNKKKLSVSIDEKVQIKETEVVDERSKSFTEESIVDLDDYPAMLQISTYLQIGHKEDKVRWALTRVEEEKECLEVYLEDGFIGGSCLCINPSDEICSEHRYTRLFPCDFLCEDTLVFCVVTKVLKSSEFQHLNMVMHMIKGSERKRVVLVGRPLKYVLEQKQDTAEYNYLYPLDPKDAGFEELRKYLLIHEPGFYVSVDNQYGWLVNYYSLRMPRARLVAVNCRTRMPHGPILLGHFGICCRDQSKVVV